MTAVQDSNPFSQAAEQTRVVAERAQVSPDERDRLLRLVEWYEEEAARWNQRRGLLPAPRTSVEALPRRVPGQSWAAVTGIPLERTPSPAVWKAEDLGAGTLVRLADALRRMPL